MLDGITQDHVNEDTGNRPIEPSQLSIVRILQVVPYLLINRKVDALDPDAVLSGWKLRVLISGLYQESDNSVADLDAKHHTDRVTIGHEHRQRIASIEDGRVTVPSLGHDEFFNIVPNIHGFVQILRKCVYVLKRLVPENNLGFQSIFAFVWRLIDHAFEL